MVCTTKQAASALAHKRWGTKAKTNKIGKKKKSGIAIKEKEKEAPGVKQRRKNNQPSTHFTNSVANLEQRAAALDAKYTDVVDLKRIGLKGSKTKMGGSNPVPVAKKKYVKKKSSKSQGTLSKPTISGPINMLTPRRKKK